MLRYKIETDWINAELDFKDMKEVIAHVRKLAKKNINILHMSQVQYDISEEEEAAMEMEDFDEDDDE